MKMKTKPARSMTPGRLIGEQGTDDQVGNAKLAPARIPVGHRLVTVFRRV